MYNTNLTDRTTLFIDNIIHLLGFGLEAIYFSNRGNKHQQVFRTLMGCPVSAIVANMVMKSHLVQEKENLLADKLAATMILKFDFHCLTQSYLVKFQQIMKPCHVVRQIIAARFGPIHIKTVILCPRQNITSIYTYVLRPNMNAIVCLLLILYDSIIINLSIISHSNYLK